MNKQLNIPLGEFTKKVNTAFASLESNLRLGEASPAAQSDVRTSDIRTAEINENLAYTLWCVPKRRIIKTLTFIGGGKGTIDSGIDVLYGLIATVMAVSDTPKTEASSAVIALLDKNKADTAIIKGVKYEIAQFKELGTWLTVTAADSEEATSSEQT